MAAAHPNIMVNQCAIPCGIVTFLFTDIEGSTRLVERLGAGYVGVLESHRRLLRTFFTRWNGHEVDTQGDSFFVVFKVASEALACACEAQYALARQAWPGRVKVKVRMGLHTGEPLMVGEEYLGMDVHRAARIAAAGHGGQVLLSKSTVDQVQNALPTGARLRELGTYRLRDIRCAQQVYQLVIDGLQIDFPPLRSIYVETAVLKGEGDWVTRGDPNDLWLLGERLIVDGALADLD